MHFRPLESAGEASRHLAQRLLDSAAGDRLLRTFNAKAVSEYLKQPGPHKLHLGCGNRILPGWLNADLPSIRRLLLLDRRLLAVNCRRTLPFDGSLFDRIFTEHMHEHLSYHEGFRLLGDLKRILKPNGMLRLALPDLEFHVQMLNSTRDFSEFPQLFAEAIRSTSGLEGAPLTKTTFINFLFRGSEHKYIYSREEIERQLTSSGFLNISFHKPGESQYPEFRDLETNPVGRGTEQLDVHVAYTFAVEAMTPGAI